MNALRRSLFCVVLVVVLLSSLGAAPARSAEPASPATPARSLGDLLAPDGTLNLTTGLTGSLDPAGYQLVSGDGEAPRFALVGAESAGDERWAGSFNGLGVNGDVNALVVDASGALYVGGNFTAAGAVAANNVAKWDGSAWSALGTGLNGVVRALALDGGGNLYAGGQFTSPAYVAKWSGTAWTALGSGMNSDVYALAFDGTNLYAGAPSPRRPITWPSGPQRPALGAPWAVG